MFDEHITYFDSAKGESISYLRAVAEVKKHGADIEDFNCEVGVRERYDAQEVLTWLGY